MVIIYNNPVIVFMEYSPVKDKQKRKRFKKMKIITGVRFPVADGDDANTSDTTSAGDVIQPVS